MNKTSKKPSATVVRDAKSGRSVEVKGAGALKDNKLEIEKGVSLLKPIAKQVVTRGFKRKAG